MDDRLDPTGHNVVHGQGIFAEFSPRKYVDSGRLPWDPHSVIGDIRNPQSHYDIRTITRKTVATPEFRHLYRGR
ncbi:hypothetical protein [Nocardia sp. NPDC057440]|uniref:hypothetical protein n=1 Tax=Nocardia sp. NPDC057440 TaxID=3346134 RepID=UPI00366EB7FA